MPAWRRLCGNHHFRGHKSVMVSVGPPKRRPPDYRSFPSGPQMLEGDCGERIRAAWMRRG